MSSIPFERLMAYECGPHYVQSLNLDYVQILKTLLIDEDCQVLLGMNDMAIAIKEPKKNKAKVPKNEKS